jgi:hypothetical protein
MKISNLLRVGLMSISLMCSSQAKTEFSSQQTTFFETEVRPLLKDKCLECHSSEHKIKGGLSMDTRDELLKGGESGAVIDLKNSKASLLLRAINWDGDLHMPEKQKLSPEQIDVLTKWVEQGLPDTRDGSNVVKKDKKEHWAFQPVIKPKIPTVKNESWCYNKIDYFILSKLEERGIIPAPTAHKETLLRRAYFDLIGVPPSPKDIEAFMMDETSGAMERVVDKLLADPGYGERWGRHWMDTARYSDTTGELGNIRLNDYRYPYAWSYRDWVINALNSDMPYDEFIKHQIAADKIPDNSVHNLAALGFLTVGQRFPAKDDIINDRIDVITRGMLGLTVACARCHDHKFDPVTAADYYALRGVFASCTEPKEGPVIAGDPQSKSYQEFQQKLKDLELKSYQGYYSLIRTHSDRVRKNAAVMAEYVMLSTKDSTPEQIKTAAALIEKHKIQGREVTDTMGRRFRANDPVMGPFVRLATTQDSFDQIKNGKYSKSVIEFLSARSELPRDKHGVATLVGEYFAHVEPLVANMYTQITDVNTDPQSLVADLVESVCFPFNVTVASQMDIEKLREDGNRLPLPLQGELRGKVFINNINELKLTFVGGPVRAMVLEDTPKPVDSPLFVRGNVPKPGEPVRIVPRRFIEVLTGGEAQPFSKDNSGRLELAQAIASKNNPLTARVLVNRVWMYHFGEGLVKTPDDLGNQAGVPTHPELLDFLANWFMEDYGPKKPAWSMKALHKAIMLSKVYQQSSNTFSKVQLKEYGELDPSNSLLWHANVRRLDFESYRDSLLSMAGVLQRGTVGGPSFNVTEEPFIFRRTAYAYIDRGNMPDVMMQFDMANPDQPNSKRTSTIVPQQALFLMNSPLVAQVVQKISQRPEMQQAVAREKNTDRGIVTVFKIVLQRTPTAIERKMALEFLLKENKEQAAVRVSAETITSKAKKLAETKLKQAQNNKDFKQAIVNQGELVERVAFSPWEALIQSLIFSNEAAYMN